MKIVRPKIKKRPDNNFERLVAQESLILETTEEICRALESAAITRQELAERLGKSKGFVTQVLSGERNMTLRTAADLATALDHRLQVKAVPGGKHVQNGIAPSYLPNSAFQRRARGEQCPVSTHLGAVGAKWDEFAPRAVEPNEQTRVHDHEFSLTA